MPPKTNLERAIEKKIKEFWDEWGKVPAGAKLLIGGCEFIKMAASKQHCIDENFVCNCNFGTIHPITLFTSAADGREWLTTRLLKGPVNGNE